LYKTKKISFLVSAFYFDLKSTFFGSNDVKTESPRSSMQNLYVLISQKKKKKEEEEENDPQCVRQ
jgi:hypothetical protein